MSSIDAFPHLFVFLSFSDAAVDATFAFYGMKNKNHYFIKEDGKMK